MKVAVFIDNSNTFKNIKRIREADPDWVCLYDPLKLAQKLAGNRELVSVRFYCVQPPAYLLKEDEEHIRKYKIAMKYYAAVEKLPLVEVKYGDLRGIRGEMKEKNVDTQISIDLVTGAAFNKFDVAILVSSDGDCVSAVENVKKFGKKVELVFFKGSISMNLKKSCDVPRRARRSYFQPLNFKKD